jgi:hypothetical protein
LYSGTEQQSQKAIGWFGYVEAWADAWQETAYPVSSITNNTLTVDGDVDELDVLGIQYEYPIMSLLKIDNELMVVGDRNPANNTLTVKRGVNGTTSVSHDEVATIYRFQPDEIIARAARRLASWYYFRKSTARGDLDRPIMTANGIVLPAKFPADIAETIRSFRHAGLS